MSQQNDHAEGYEPNHEGPIKTPKQLVATVVASFLVPIFAIILLVNYVDFGAKPAAGSEGLGPEAVAKRLQPVGRVEVRDASNPGALKTGEQVYAAVCTACHAAGAAGAPKFGDKAAWAPRLTAGRDAMLTSALKGKGAMPPKAGNPKLSDEEIGAALDHMLAAVK